MTDQLVVAQREALARVSGLLDGAGIDHWLFGGWGRDFYASLIPPEHA